MADQISLRLAETQVTAGSAVSVTATFRDRATAAASTPTSIRYRVDCLTTGRQIINDTSASAASSATITIPGPNNGTINDGNDFEVRQITVTADYGLDTQVKQSATWRVRTIHAYDFPHVFPDPEERLEPFYPITESETAAGLFEENLRTQYEPGYVDRTGADPTGVADSSAAINAALSANQPVYLGAPGRHSVYLANNLTQTHNFQKIIAVGTVHLKKNANGAILTVAGSHVEIEGVSFYGDASTPTFTGDNLVLSADHPRLINCGSRWAYGRAVRATGNHVQILGTCDIYQTADTTGTGYDIEIGASGTATLYHHLNNIYSSQPTGGILFVDCGGQSVVGGQIGKLSITSGTSPSGVNGGTYTNLRIIGAVVIDISNAQFAANQFASTITIGTGVSGVIIDETNAHQGGVPLVTNNGNADNYWANVSTVGIEPNSDIRLVNGKSFRIKRAAGTNGFRVTLSASDLCTISNDVSAEDIIINQEGAGTINLDVNGARSVQVDANATAGNTRFLIYDVDNATLERVTVGAADSGGAGFKCLRIPN